MIFVKTVDKADSLMVKYQLEVSMGIPVFRNSSEIQKNIQRKERKTLAYL